MKTAADFRAEARNALNGKWLEAVLITLIASFLGANIYLSGASPTMTFNLSGEQTQQLSQGISQEQWQLLVPILMVVGTISLIITVGRFIVGAFVGLGLIQYNMNLIDKEKPAISDLFSKTSLWGKAALLRLRILVFTALWTLLFIIPGIIKHFSYSMAGFIMTENPEIDGKTAVKLSMEMMKGNKWRLFCLTFSFIGWALLCILTLFIGLLWLNPYINASVAAFYDDISKDYSQKIRASSTK